MLISNYQIVIVAAGVVIILWKLFSQFRRYREVVAIMKDIDGDRPHWLLGHLRTVGVSSEHSFHQQCNLLQRYPKCQPVWIGPFMAYLRGYYPDFMRSILNSHAPKEDVAYRFLRPWIGNGILTSTGEKWKRTRRLVTPAFHFEILKSYLKCMNGSTTELLDIWSEKIDGGNSTFAEVEIFGDLGRLALDVILRCILSKESGCQRDGSNEYLQSVKYLTETSFTRLCKPLYHFDAIFYLTSKGKAYKRALKIAHDYISSVLDERRRSVAQGEPNEQSQNMDLLGILLHATDDMGEGLSREEIHEELDAVIFAGHDTVSSALSWAFYNLAAYPACQNRCRKEVMEVLGDKSTVEWEDLPKLSYLTMFIKESMRLYSPVFSVGRKSTEPIRFPRGFGKDQYDCKDATPGGSVGDFAKTFPKNTTFNASIQYLHCNPYVWENPFVFDPERFTAENCNKRSPFAYLPFSAGPRNCIGQNFAMNEMKLVLSRTLAKFEIFINENMPKAERKIDIIQRSRTGIHLKLAYHK